MSPFQPLLGCSRHCRQSRLAEEEAGAVLFIIDYFQPTDYNSVDQQIFQLGACRRFQARFQVQHMPTDCFLAEQIGVDCQLEQREPAVGVDLGQLPRSLLDPVRHAQGLVVRG